jgi:hypothetical protein
MYYFNVSKNDTNTCVFIFDFMKCKSVFKNGVGWLINEDKKLPSRNMSTHNLSRYKIKDNLSSFIPSLDKDFKTQWANISINEILYFDKLITLIPSKLLAIYECNKDVPQPPLRIRKWTWLRPINIINIML